MTLTVYCDVLTTQTNCFFTILKAKMKDIPEFAAQNPSTAIFLQKDAKNALTNASAKLPFNEIHYSQSSSIPIPFTGDGRLCTLEDGVPLETLVQRVKDHLKLHHLRLAVARGRSLESIVRSVIVHAGSWQREHSRCRVDVYLTGEMSHHEVLDATQNGTSVILCEHSNTERGYLTVMKGELIKILACDESAIITSAADRDPLEIV